MSFGEAIKACFQKYATFSGRARRSEYWYFYLFYFLVSFGLSFLSILTPFARYMSLFLGLAFFIPNLAVCVRRFHDIGKSGWNYLIILIPELLLNCYLLYLISYVIKESKLNNGVVKNFLDGGSPSLNFLYALGAINLAVIILWLIWMTEDSQPGENKWGPNPKELPGNEPQNLD